MSFIRVYTLHTRNLLFVLTLLYTLVKQALSYNNKQHFQSIFFFYFFFYSSLSVCKKIEWINTSRIVIIVELLLMCVRLSWVSRHSLVISISHDSFVFSYILDFHKSDQYVCFSIQLFRLFVLLFFRLYA